MTYWSSGIQQTNGEQSGILYGARLQNDTPQSHTVAVFSELSASTSTVTDESLVYPSAVDGRAHGSVHRRQEEYVGAYWSHMNTVEGYFSILKHGINGVYYHVSPAHLHHYAAEFDFRYNE